MRLANVQITRDNVYFDGLPLPKYIAKDGIAISRYDDDVNRLKVEFIVGTVELEDSTAEKRSTGSTPIYSELAHQYGYAAPGFDEKWDKAWDALCVWPKGYDNTEEERPRVSAILNDGTMVTDHRDADSMRREPDRIRLALKTLQKMNAVLNNLYGKQA